MLNYIILGIVQGLTEFLPVSSSAHLVFAQRLLGMSGNGLAISIALHLGTVFSLIIFFSKDIFKILSDKKLFLMILVVTIVTGIIGVSGKDFFESIFGSPKMISIALIITGIILLLTAKAKGASRKGLNIKDSFIFGIVQGIAVIPGISRSGSTISTLLFRGIDRDACFRFSLLASIPAVIGAAILEARHIGFIFGAEPKYLLAGFICSLLAGILSLWILKIVLHKAKLFYFGFYCIIVGIIGTVLNSR
ncbi:MAG TPA: undecaprenyl-diphosphate phosphatase [Candidatus Omnitrophota bacterium]|nr:undecaprenyl-diphosphate phosphatase [Candidatus Omnitrophota bacterium]